MPHDIELPIWPSIINCIAWSQDCELAIAAEGHVELVIPKLNLSKLNLRNSYDNLWTTLHLRVDQFAEDEVQTQEPLSFANFSIGEELSNGSVVALEWSPPGLTKHKRCVLAVLTSNLVLSIWTPGVDPSKLSEWRRVLVINQVLDRFFQSNQSSNGMDDDTGLEFSKRKQRVRAISWSPPARIDYGVKLPNKTELLAPTWMAVSNDCNEIIIMRMDYQRRQGMTEEKSFEATPDIHFSIDSLDHTESLNLTDTFEDCLLKPKFVSHLAWSPWILDSNKSSTVDGEPVMYAFLAYATASKFAIRRVYFESKLHVDTDNFFESPSFSSPLGQLRWFPKPFSQDLTLFVTTTGEICRYTFGLDHRADVKVEVDPFEGWDAVSGLAPSTCHITSPVLYYSKLTTLPPPTANVPFIRSNTFVNFTAKSADDDNEARSWLKKLIKQREEFSNTNHLDGKVRSKVWGLASSPLGNLIAAVSTHHPDDMPEYVIPADYRSMLSISNHLDDVAFQLPLHGGITPVWNDLTSETLVFSLLHWLVTHKDVSWEDASIREHLVKSLEDARAPLPSREEPTVEFKDVSFESEDWELVGIQYLRQNLYNTKQARSRLCERIVSLVDSSVNLRAIDDGSTARVLSSVVVKLPLGLDRSKISRKIRALYNEAHRLSGGSQVYNSTNGHQEDLFEYCGICKSNVRLPFKNIRYAIGTCGHQFGKCSGMRAIPH